MLLDYLAVRLNAPKAAGKKIDTFPFWFNVVHSQVERPIGEVHADLREGGSLGPGTLFDWRYYW